MVPQRAYVNFNRHLDECSYPVTPSSIGECKTGERAKGSSTSSHDTVVGPARESIACHRAKFARLPNQTPRPPADTALVSGRRAGFRKEPAPCHSSLSNICPRHTQNPMGSRCIAGAATVADAS